MDDRKKTKDQLVQELAGLRQRVAELEKSEETLRESGEKFVKIFQISPDAVAISRTSDGTYLDVNEGFSKLSGYSREELIGRSPLPGDLNLWLSGEDRETFAQALQETGEALGIEIKFRRKDGALRNGLLSARVLDIAGDACHLSIVSDFTEQKRVEKTLLDNQEKLRMAQTIGKIGNWSWNIEPDRAEWSDQVYEIFRAPRKEPSYEFAKSFVHPDDLDLWQNTVRQAVEKKQPFTLDYRAIRSDGETIWVHNETRTVCSEQGELIGYQGIVQDISERKQAEEALAASEKKYRDIFENAAGGIFRSTPDGRLLDVNPYFAHIAGFDTPEQMLAEVSDIASQLYVNPEDREELKRLLQERGKLEGYEVQAYGRNKSRNWISLNIQAIRDAAGNILFYQGMFSDVTMRKQAEAALRVSQETLSSIFKIIPIPVSVIRLSDGNFLNVNDSFSKVTGYSREEVIGRPYFSNHPNIWVHQRDRLRLVKVLRKTGEVHAFEALFRSKSEKEICGLISAQVLDINGEACIVGIVNDVTEQKHTKQVLEGSKERLRALSARLQTVREEERASIAREIHDNLGQLLTGLKMDLSWFLRNPQPDTKTMNEKVKAMGQLVDQTVQTVRRISTELRPRILDDFGLLAALEWQAEEFSKKTGIPCLFRSPIRKIDLEPDRSIAVFRIFQETLTNVARHAEATKVEASLKKNAKGLVLTVRDNGRGISGEEVSNHQSLGLVGMRERALIFGGTVEFQGKNGKGTTVVLSLPIT
jgi:PAS domain S-box-containing protein